MFSGLESCRLPVEGVFLEDVLGLGEQFDGLNDHPDFQRDSGQADAAEQVVWLLRNEPTGRDE